MAGLGWWNILYLLKISYPLPEGWNAWILFWSLNLCGNSPLLACLFFFFPQVCILWKWFLVETAINTGKSTGKYYDVGHAKGKTRWLLSSPSQTCRPDFESMLFSASTPLLCLHFNLWVSQVTSPLHGLGKLELVPCVSATARALGSVWCL